MLSVAQIISHPFVSLKKRFRRRKTRAFTDSAPPPIKEDKLCEFGGYCMRATVFSEINGKTDRTFTGYSQNPDITVKTENACARFKSDGSTCTTSALTFIGDVDNCDEHIMMKLKNGEVVFLM